MLKKIKNKTKNTITVLSFNIEIFWLYLAFSLLLREIQYFTKYIKVFIILILSSCYTRVIVGLDTISAENG